MIKYENVSFNTKVILTYSLSDFLKTHDHLWPKIDVETRKKRLREVYKLAKEYENAR